MAYHKTTINQDSNNVGGKNKRRRKDYKNNIIFKLVDISYFYKDLNIEDFLWIGWKVYREIFNK